MSRTKPTTDTTTQESSAPIAPAAFSAPVPITLVHPARHTIASTSVPSVPTVEDTLDAYRKLTTRERRAFVEGLDQRFRAAVRTGDGEIARAYLDLVEAVTAPGAEVDDDLEAARRYATFEVVMTAMWDAMSPRARTLHEGGAAPIPALEVRLAGAVAAKVRTAVSGDGGTRVASGEAKGSIKDLIVAALSTRPAMTWWTVSEIQKWGVANGAEFGYTATYVPSGGAITRAATQVNDELINWRRNQGIVAEQRDNGNGRVVWMISTTGH